MFSFVQTHPHSIQNVQSNPRRVTFLMTKFCPLHLFHCQLLTKKKKWVISGYVTYVAWRTFWMNGCYYIIENLNSCAVDNELASTEQELTDGWSLFHDASSDNFGFWSTYIPTEFWMPENINQKDSRVYKRVITTMFMLCCIVVWCCVVTWHDMKWLNMT